MKYKYNITHSVSGKKTVINFKNERSLVKHLTTNQDSVNQLERVYINFSSISLPLKATVWYIPPVSEKREATPKVKKPRKKTARSKEKAAENRRLKKFIKRLES